LQIFSPEVTLICDHVWINVGTYDPKTSQLFKVQNKIFLGVSPFRIVVCGLLTDFRYSYRSSYSPYYAVSFTEPDNAVSAF